MPRMQSGPMTSRSLETRRRKLLAGLLLPVDGLPGSLSLSHRHCGTQGCHCHEGDGHPSWTLTFMVEGKKRVEHIPTDQVEAVRRRVKEGNAFKQATAELMATNAQLMVLERRERAARARASKSRAVR